MKIFLPTAVLMFAWLLSGVAHADGFGGGADEVTEAIAKYWAARNINDHETAANLESRTGTYNTNSDGSFHKPINVSTAEDWKRNMAGQQNNMRVFYPEVAEISAGVVYARYYMEGMIGDAGTEGAQHTYRTRVTNVWTKESDGQWRLKAAHFSSSSYGGTHRTQTADFED